LKSQAEEERTSVVAFHADLAKRGLSKIGPTDGLSGSKSVDEQTMEEEETFRRRRVEIIFDYPYCQK